MTTAIELRKMQLSASPQRPGGIIPMIGQLLCALGLHRVVTTREGKTPASVKQRQGAGAATFIHCFCYREGCKFHVIIDTHNGEKVLHVDHSGHQVVPAA